MGIPSSVYILPNAIDTHAFSFDSTARRLCRSQLGIAPETPVIGHVGRMVEVKNHRFLLEAFSICHRAVPAAQLLLIGDGPLEQMLRTQAADLGIQGSVHFLGSRRDTRLLYAAMDVFAMPSLYEGLSMALLEAQASGLPCLASDTVSPESNVTNRMVRLPLEQPKDWAVAFEKQLKAPADRTRDVTEAFARRNLDIHTAVRQLTELYERN